jgi:hypothetical protein
VKETSNEKPTTKRTLVLFTQFHEGLMAVIDQF